LEGLNNRGLRRTAAMSQSVHEPTPDVCPSLAHLRDQLIDLTVQLADLLVADGDADRLTALTALYQSTKVELERRGGSR
jgi:hypothetical protein